MKLKDCREADLVQGRLVVLLAVAGSGGLPELRLVERREGTLVFLEPTALFLEDDEVSETFAVGEALKRLRIPEVEVGDEVFYRTRPARVTRASGRGDLHVHVAFHEAPDTENYTNLIHLDFTPTLIAFAAE